MAVPWYNVDEGVSGIFYAFEAVFITLLCTNIVQYAWWLKNAARDPAVKKRRTQGYYLLWLALPLNLAFPYAVVVIYIGKVGLPGSKMWKDGSWVPNTPLGITLWVLKYIGFVLLTIGILKVTGLVGKIQKRWREIRSGEKTTKSKTVPVTGNCEDGECGSTCADGECGGKTCESCDNCDTCDNFDGNTAAKCGLKNRGVTGAGTTGTTGTKDISVDVCTTHS